jgi:hypothetical protein
MKLRRTSTIQSHSYQHFQELSLSSKEFYKLIEEEIKLYQFPDVTIHRVSIQESNWFSGNRDYLEVKRKEYRFAICAAPFGRSFFISWWLKQADPDFFERLFYPRGKRKSMYQTDTELMFSGSISAIVETAIQQVLRDKGYKTDIAIE